MANDGNKPLAGRVAVVTGGGAGIGRGEAIQLARAGAKVVVNDLRAEFAHRVAGEIEDLCGRAVAVPASVSTLRGAGEIIDAAMKAFGRLDILVNNAGTVHWSPLEAVSEKHWDLVTAVNLKGSFATIHHAIPIFRAQKGGVIINTSSEAGLGGAYLSSYSATKEALIGLTRAVAFELGADNVRCNAIRPRAFDAGPNAETYRKSVEFEDRFGRPAYGSHPMRHTIFPRAEEVGAIVTWLCTDDAASVNGRTFIVGGGEVALMSEPEVLRSCFNADGWSMDSLPGIKDYLFQGLDRNGSSLSAEALEFMKS
ncbi:MAG: SDR family NAD(P)-dependent oxidoreductase [Gammaproteobacteria bacterium]